MPSTPGPNVFETLRRGRALVLAMAGLFVGALVLGLSELAIGQGAFDIALLILLTLGALVLLPWSRSLSFLYACAALPAIIALNRHAGPWGPGRLTFYFLLLLYLAVGLVSWLRSPPHRVPLRATGWATVVLLLYLLAIALLADDPGAALETWVNHGYHWPFLVLPTLLLRRQSHVRLLLLFVAGLGTLLALASIGVSFLLSNPASLLAHGGTYQRVHLYFGTANTLGLFLSLALFTLLYGVNVEARWLRWLKVGGQAVILLAILLTFSRRTWLATGLLLLFHYLWRRDWRGVVVVALVGGALGYQMREQISERAETIIDPEHSSNIERKREITEHLDFLFAGGVSMTGWGMERAVAASASDVSHALYFHNYYLTLYYVSGAIGLLLFLFVVGATLRGLRRVQLLARGPTPRGAAAAGLATLAIVLLSGMFGNANMTFPVNYFSALLPGLGFAALALEGTDESPVSGGAGGSA